MCIRLQQLCGVTSTVEFFQQSEAIPLPLLRSWCWRQMVEDHDSIDLQSPISSSVSLRFAIPERNRPCTVIMHLKWRKILTNTKLSSPHQPANQRLEIVTSEVQERQEQLYSSKITDQPQGRQSKGFQIQKVRYTRATQELFKFLQPESGAQKYTRLHINGSPQCSHIPVITRFALQPWITPCVSPHKIAEVAPN